MSWFKPPLRWKTSFLYKQEIPTTQMTFQVVCQNIPIGSYISITSETSSSSKGDPSPPITLEKTKVTTLSSFMAGVSSTVPQGYVGTITFSLFAKKHLKDEGHASLLVSYVEPSPTKGGHATTVVVKQLTTAD